MYSVVPNKSFGSIRAMLPSTASNIARDTDIKRTIASAGEDVDAGTLLTHAPIGRSGSPLSRGRRRLCLHRGEHACHADGGRPTSILLVGEVSKMGATGREEHP